MTTRNAKATTPSAAPNALTISQFVLTTVLFALALVGSIAGAASRITSIEAKVDNHIALPAHPGTAEKISLIQTDLATVRNDIRWIRESLARDRKPR